MTGELGVKKEDEHSINMIKSSQKLDIQRGLCALRHGIQDSKEAILAYHSALSPQNDRTAWQKGVNDDVFAQAPLF